jgi:hypothetical protein
LDSPWSLEDQPVEVAVDDRAHASAARAPSAGAIANGGQKRQAERIRKDPAASVEIDIQRLANVLPQVDQSIAAPAAHQQRPLVVATLEVVDVVSRDLDKDGLQIWATAGKSFASARNTCLVKL